MKASDPLVPTARQVYVVRYQRRSGAVGHRFYQRQHFAATFGQRMRSRGARVVVYTAEVGDWTEQRMWWHYWEDLERLRRQREGADGAAVAGPLEVSAGTGRPTDWPTRG